MALHLWCYSLDMTQMVSSQHPISLSQVITWPPDPFQSELCFPMNLSLLLCSPCSMTSRSIFVVPEQWQHLCLNTASRRAGWNQELFGFLRKREHFQTKKKAEGKTRQRGLWALATITAGMLWPWRKGRWEKQMGPDAWMMPHKTMEDISFKIDKNSIRRQSNCKLLGAESLKYTVLIFHIYKQLCNVIKIGQSVAGIPSSITASRCVAI